MRTWVRPDGRRFAHGEPDGELPPGELFASADAADTERLAALAALAFEPLRRELHLLLPVTVPRVAAPEGIRLLHADEVPERELRLLDDELRQDVPGTDGWRWRPEDFRAETYESPQYDAAVYLVAAVGDEAVAIARVWLRPERPRLGFVGTRRELRRRGISRWLLGEAFAVLRERGHAEISTEVDEANVASRTLLDAIGGRRIGAAVELRRGPAVTIRAASAGDVEALAALAARTWLDAFGDSLPPAEAAAEIERTRSPERFRRALAERTVLVAEREGRLAGYAELSDGELERLYVDMPLHGHGIGARLAAAALAHPRLARAERVRLQVWERNERALRLYERLGFRRGGVVRFTLGDGTPAEDVLMELES
ncbi:MAG TPA: GNAT family N-acetyltransferase [Gaiellaceae bacterium]|nr:GNAT family N-acetyltransferase [Gaiellaceae bacterium]